MKGKIEAVEIEEDDLMIYTDNYLKDVDVDIKHSVLSSTTEIKRRLRCEHESGCVQFKKHDNLEGMAFYFNESSQ